MLVLSRKLEQRIVLGDGIRITVVAIEGGRVRLGIEAPPQVAVVRAEIAGEGGGPSRPDRRGPAGPRRT
ncbi:carbon storage regulator [Tautonia plasticadhaerens]|uniref:Translational regulator CsrA n=1 Tax=Tautonia plasticadhaerens TaxID=2527974 RepID=A0A518HAX4_9BACT|nr:carbon storage regulator [Tautonia plasticadhaerens]QDV38012.1 hypothetical protein ElP_59600 [Tautonia plasticadhaerens]